jgi:hypothetical protein
MPLQIPDDVIWPSASAGSVDLRPTADLPAVQPIDEAPEIPRAPSSAPTAPQARALPPDIIWPSAPSAGPKLQPTRGAPPVQGFDGSRTAEAESEIGTNPEVEAMRGVAPYAREFVTSAAEGAKNLVAGGIKGLGANLATAPGEQVRRQLIAMDRIDRGERLTIDEDPLGYQDMSPEQRAQARAEYQNFKPTKVVEHPVYKTGKAVEDFGESVVGPAPGWEDSWTRKIGGGAGSVVGGIGAAMIPGVGPYVAGSTFLMSGSGEAADRAVKAGATEEQIGKAARFGSIAGATDVVDALLPALGTMGKVAGFLKRVGYAAVVDSIAEGGQEGLQQLIQNMIAKGIYKPDQDLTEDVAENALVGAIVGGGFGTVHAAVERHDNQHPVAPANSFQLDKATNTAETVLSQSPQPQPSALAAGYNAAQSVLSGTEPPPPPAGAPPPAAAPVAMPAGLSPVEQRLLLAQGLTPEQIAAMTRPQIDAVIEQAGETAGAAQPTAPLDAQPQAASVSRETALQNATAVLNASPSPSRVDLQQLLDDPRSAEEIAAERQRAAEWAPSDEWQVVPQGARLDPTLDLRTAEDGTQQARLAPTPGTRAAPVQLETPDDVHLGAEQTAIPTPAQAEAGNYRKRHVKFDGMDVSVETEQGATRSGVGPDGKPWSVTMPNPYGQILDTKGADGDPLDITIGPNPQAPHVYVFDQIDPESGKFDEHKSFAGFNSPAEARAAYEGSFSDGSGYLRAGSVTEMPRQEFKTWAKSGNTTKPLAYREPPPIPVTQRKRADRGPYSLMEFIASKGGLKPDPELRAIFDGNPMVPGMGRLIRATGRSLDEMRNLATQNGYFRDTPYEGGVSTSSVRDFLDAMDGERTGNKLYSEHDLADVAERQERKAAEAHERHRKEIGIALRATAKQIDVNNLTEDELTQAVNLVVEQGYDLDEALVDVVERSAMAADADLLTSEVEHSHANEPEPANDVGEKPDAAVAVATGTEGGTEGEHPPRRDQPHQVEQAPARAEAAGPTEASQPVARAARPQGPHNDIAKRLTDTAVVADSPTRSRSPCQGRQADHREDPAGEARPRTAASSPRASSTARTCARRARARGQHAHQGDAPPARR